jgi:hypothetical protein
LASVEDRRPELPLGEHRGDGAGRDRKRNDHDTNPEAFSSRGSMQILLDLFADVWLVNE